MKDRRVRKTEQAIQSALAKLILEKDFANITIKELCDVADINKSTFYLHYRDIYDCADSLLSDSVDKTIAIMADYDFIDLVNHLPEIMEKIKLVFREDKEFFIPFLSSPKYSFALHKIKKLTIERLLEQNTNDKIPPVLAKCVTSFIICGIFGVLEQNQFNEITPDVTSVLTNKIQNGFISSSDTYK